MKTSMSLMAVLLLLSIIFIAGKKNDHIPAAKPAVIAAVSSHNQYNRTFTDEVTLKYIYGITAMRDCSGRDKKMINGVCETGRRVNYKTVKGSGGRWFCYFNYEFSDGSVNGPYSETNTAPCFVD